MSTPDLANALAEGTGIPATPVAQVATPYVLIWLPNGSYALVTDQGEAGYLTCVHGDRSAHQYPLTTDLAQVIAVIRNHAVVTV